jgi:ribosomal protein L16/L10AE
MGRAALVKPGQVLYIIGVKTPKAEKRTRKLISAIKPRLPCKVSVEKIEVKA